MKNILLFMVMVFGASLYKCAALADQQADQRDNAVRQLKSVVWPDITPDALFEICKQDVVNADLGEGKTPLYMAVMWGNRRAAEELLNLGAAVNQAAIYNVTPLMKAVLEGYEDMVSFLVGRGASVSLADARGRTAIDIARELHLSKIEDILQKAMEDVGPEWKGGSVSPKSLLIKG